MKPFMPMILSGALLVAGLLVGGCSNDQGSSPAAKATVTAPLQETTLEGPPYFEDKTAGSGIDHIYKNGEEAGHFAILESLGGGLGLLDYNRDGLLDIFLNGGGYYKDKQPLGLPCKLYRNDGNWHFTDVSKEVGFSEMPFYNHGASVGDYNGDGWPDLLVTGYGRMGLFRNDKGKFTDVTEQAGLLDKRDIHWSTSAGWADLNGDGLTDLYVTHYVDWHLLKHHPRCNDSTGERRDVCSPKQFEGLVDALYINNGDGTFRDATQEAGILPGKGLGVLIVDVNHDGKPDIYVANDTRDNYLYINMSDREKIRFEERADALAVARDEAGMPNGSMGVDAADYDGSGHMSVFVTNYQHEAHALYRNLGKGPFRYASPRAGITAIGLVYVGFGTVFIDIDNDGAEDVFITNGHVVRFPPPPGTLLQRPTLLKNLRKPGDKPLDVRFSEIGSRGGSYFQVKHMGRGVASGDLDNDGRVDLVLNNMNEKPALLRNVAPEKHHWLGVCLEGKGSREAVGAELTLEVDGRKLVRGVKGGRSYLSSCDCRIVFGLGEHAKFDKLTIKWPSGHTQTFTQDQMAIDRYWNITEGNDKPGEGAKPVASTGKGEK